MTWLYRRSPVFQRATDADDGESAATAHRSRVKAVALLVAGIGINAGWSRADSSGCAHVGDLGPAVRDISGHGFLLTFNLGLVALIRPLTADPLVLRLHGPYLAGCILIIACALLSARRLGRSMGALLLVLYTVYLALNLSHMWR